MEDLVKKFIYTGVGFVTSTTEKMQKAVDNLIEQGKVSEVEGKKVVEDLLKDTETKRAEFETKVKDLFDSAKSKLSFSTPAPQTTKASTLEQLMERIEALEAKAEALKKATRKATIKKVPTAKIAVEAPVEN